MQSVPPALHWEHFAMLTYSAVRRIVILSIGVVQVMSQLETICREQGDGCYDSEGTSYAQCLGTIQPVLGYAKSLSDMEQTLNFISM